jgi:hypothetical protein
MHFKEFYVIESIGHENIGLPTKTDKKYKTDIKNGHTIKSCNKSWHGSNVGWDVWIDGKKYFKNLLTRQEAITASLKQHNKDKK